MPWARDGRGPVSQALNVLFPPTARPRRCIQACVSMYVYYRAHGLACIRMCNYTATPTPTHTLTHSHNIHAKRTPYWRFDIGKILRRSFAKLLPHAVKWQVFIATPRLTGVAIQIFKSFRASIPRPRYAVSHTHLPGQEKEEEEEEEERFIQS